MKILRNKTYENLIERMVFFEQNSNWFEHRYNLLMKFFVEILEGFDQIMYERQEELLLNLEHQGWI